MTTREKRPRRKPTPKAPAPSAFKTPPAPTVAPFRVSTRQAGAMRLVHVVHCSTREELWLPFIAGKASSRDARPKGYRVFFAPGDALEFDADGRVWHGEVAARRLWSLVPHGRPVVERVAAELDRMGLVGDYKLATWLIQQDQERAKAEVPVVVKGEVVMRKRRRDFGLPKAEKGTAQPALFALPAAEPKPRKVRPKKAKAVFAKVTP